MVIVAGFFLPFIAFAQNKYALVINLTDKDSVFSVSSSSLKLESLQLQTYFNSMSLCSDYVSHLSEALVSKGYPAASVDSVYFDSTTAHVYLFLGPQYKWAEINTDSVEKRVLDQSGWNEKQFQNKKIDWKNCNAGSKEY